MKKSHLQTPRTLKEGEWESGYYTPAEYDHATEQATKYALGLLVVVVMWLVVVFFGVL